MVEDMSDHGLQDKVAVITGGAAGIGAAVARQLAGLGANVVVGDIDGDAGAQLCRELAESGHTALSVQVDMGSPAAVNEMIEAAVAEFGGVDVLHSNASARNLASRDGKCADIDLDLWNAHIAVDLTGAMLATKLVLPHMLGRGGGSLIYTSSVSATHPLDTRTAYSAVKAGLIGLSAAVAVQYGKQGIRSNVVVPGPIMSSMFEQSVDAETARIFRSHVLTPDLGEPDDVAALVAFLASDTSRYITGQMIRVDGGLTAYQAYVPALRDAAQRPR
jgi:NAD(P)-dependent dehydrogenase (short-subunit alcohol dehydrogenase family)